MIHQTKPMVEVEKCNDAIVFLFFLLHFPFKSDIESFTLANEAFHGGNYPEAIRYWKQCFTEMDAVHYIVLYINCGAAYERLNHYSLALDMYAHALSLDPDNMEALHNQGVVYMALQRPNDALQCYQKAIQLMQRKGIFPPQTEPPFSISTALSSSSVSSSTGMHSTTVQSTFSSSSSSLSPSSITGTSFYIQPLRGICMTLLTLQRYDEAIRIADQILSIHPTDPFILADKAFALLKTTTTNTGNPETTSLTLSSIVSQDVHDVRWLINRTEEAIRVYQTVDTLLQSTKMNHSLTTWKYLPLAKLEEETHKYYGIACSQLAVLLDQTGEVLRAEVMYNTALGLEITETRLFNRANLYMRTGKSTEAINEFHKVIEFNRPLPSSNDKLVDPFANGIKTKSKGQYGYQTYAALGTLYLQHEQYDNAFTSLRHAVDIGQADQRISAEVYYNCGLAALYVKNTSEAKQCFTAALQLQPSMVIASKGLERTEEVTMQLNGFVLKSAVKDTNKGTLLNANKEESLLPNTDTTGSSSVESTTIAGSSVGSTKDPEGTENNSGKLSVDQDNDKNDHPLSNQEGYTLDATVITETGISGNPLPSSRITVTVIPEVPNNSTMGTFPSHILLSKGMYSLNGQSTPLSFITTSTLSVSKTAGRNTSSVNNKRPIANHRGEKIDLTSNSVPPILYRRNSPEISGIGRVESTVKDTDRSMGTSSEVWNEEETVTETFNVNSISARYRSLLRTEGEKTNVGDGIDDHKKTETVENNSEEDTILSTENIYPYEDLRTPGPFPENVDITHREAYLSSKEFLHLLGSRKAVWYQQPKWKRNQQKSNLGLF